ncbi:uncharacterized protein BDZ99DRAFT_462711 [Mytilinidion resinicola]|uniref:Uncharacterized protein n=1 Tax=Mytilinidion resinicola TaxID=574789 RepID=A0A6A6YMT2_9PEZI|nr:uncharacterized protein BDZ99DRAFT_462711 [Mytilinidion resinicola]KAF2810100.1 hypothetical protein BDZ99DRAFT_462711 [Mytilinidion resinicola]
MSEISSDIKPDGKLIFNIPYNALLNIVSFGSALHRTSKRKDHSSDSGRAFGAVILEGQ